MCKFLHLRHESHALVHQPDGTDKVEHTVFVKGGKTIAFEHDDTHVWYSVAKCSNKDNYCRATGRMYAERRLKCNDQRVHTVELNGRTPIDAILSVEAL